MATQMLILEQRTVLGKMLAHMYKQLVEAVVRQIRQSGEPDFSIEVEIVLCDSVDDATKAIRTRCPNIVSLGIDFPQKENGGPEVARWIQRSYHQSIRVLTHAGDNRAHAENVFDGLLCARNSILGENGTMSRRLLLECLHAPTLQHA